jgi:hypothetical protein
LVLSFGRKLLVVITIVLLAVVLISQIEYPVFLSQSSKLIILYYDYENLPFNASSFPQIVLTTLQHQFNTLMLLVYFNHEMIFNKSTLEYFFSYARSRNLTFVPSFYVESMTDSFNVTGFPWINLDMERIQAKLQPFFYDKISREGAEVISVTSPYGQPVDFAPSLDIVETYSGPPRFYFLQLAYWHPGHVCAVAPWLVSNQQQYDSEKEYCLKYTDGVMVFDYYNLLKSHLK